MSDNVSLSLVGAPTPQQVANRKPKHRWTLDEKCKAYALIKVQKVNAKEAFEQVAQEGGFSLPDSYSEHPHSHVNRFQKGFQRVIKKATENGTINSDPVIAKLREYGLIAGESKPTEETQPSEESEAVEDSIEDGELEDELTAEEEFAEDVD